MVLGPGLPHVNLPPAGSEPLYRPIYPGPLIFPSFVWISEQTAIISLYSIDWLVFITETDCVYYAVRAESLYKIQGNLGIEMVNICNMTAKRPKTDLDGLQSEDLQGTSSGKKQQQQQHQSLPWQRHANVIIMQRSSRRLPFWLENCVIQNMTWEE